MIAEDVHHCLCCITIGFIWFKLRGCHWVGEFNRSALRLIIISSIEYRQSVVSAAPQPYYISLRHVCSSATIVLHNSIMLASTTRYHPFDSEAPAAFRGTQTNNYLDGE